MLLSVEREFEKRGDKKQLIVDGGGGGGSVGATVELAVVLVLLQAIEVFPDFVEALFVFAGALQTQWGCASSRLC